MKGDLFRHFQQKVRPKSDEFLGLGGDGGYPVAPRGPAIVKTGTKVCHNQSGPKLSVDLLTQTPYMISKEGLQVFGGLQMH